MPIFAPALLLIAACGADGACLDGDEAMVGARTRMFLGTADACDLAFLTDWVEVRKEEFSAPYNQHIQSAVSTDGGVTFTSNEDRLVERAGVPEVVTGDDGAIYLYFVDGDLDHMLEAATAGSDEFRRLGWVGLGGFGLARSDDGGATFSRVDEFGIDGVYQGMIVDPEVIRLADGTWRMFYVGADIDTEDFETAWQGDGKHDLYTATSTDLVHWIQTPGSILYGPFADPTVHCFDEKACSLVSFGLDHATSPDGGLSWEFHDDDAPAGFGPEYVELTDGAMRLYYNSMDIGAPIVYVEAADGITFGDPSAAVLTEHYGEAPTFLRKSDEEWWMYTHNNESDGPPSGS